MSALLQQFGDGWSSADSKKLAAAFTDDAVFVPGPFDAPLVGAPAIEQYWRNIAWEQAEISFRFGEVYVAGPWFAAEFRCTFRRRRTGEPVDVRGGVFCEAAGDNISEMRMYWHRRTGRPSFE